jgi:hypothetical protein
MKRKELGRKWGQKNENGPLRSKKRGGGASYISATDFSAILCKKTRISFCADP